tara:strand:- start:93 stop:929 length:837 start_codon:yes stop_codon:yes gene_type:complete
MAYTGTYEQELRKNPTDYRLRAMGKKKYELKRRESDGKVTISTKDDPKTREAFGVGTKRVIDEKKKKKKKKKTLLSPRAQENLKEEMEKIRQGESKQREVGKEKEKKSNRVPADRKAYENSENAYLAIDRQTRSKEKKSKEKDPKKRDVSIPSQTLENILTGTAGVGLLGLAYAGNQLRKKKKADKLRTASDKLKNMKPETQKKYIKETLKKTMEKMKNAKPSLKQKIKSKLKKLKQKLSSGLKRSGGGVGGNVNVTPGGTGNIPPIKGQFRKTDINL